LARLGYMRLIFLELLPSPVALLIIMIDTIYHIYYYSTVRQTRRTSLSILRQYPLVLVLCQWSLSVREHPKSIRQVLWIAPPGCGESRSFYRVARRQTVKQLKADRFFWLAGAISSESPSAPTVNKAISAVAVQIVKPAPIKILAISWSTT
jgi:hypothetical protein